MRIAYLDCFSGMSGDMFLGALIDAGVSAELLEKTVAALEVGARLEISRVNRGGITATKVDVLIQGAKDLPRDEFRAGEEHAQGADQHGHEHTPGRGHTNRKAHIQRDEHDPVASRTDVSPPQGHGHRHSPGRGLKEIKTIIHRAALTDRVRTTAVSIFEVLGAAEARIHGVDIESVHFHEVGAADAIVDIVGAAVGIDALAVEEMICSPLNVGGGMVECAHGVFPVPAPATVDLLRGVPVYSSGIRTELLTPTGAAIVKALASRFGSFPGMKIEKTGHGAGGRDFPDWPNVVRLTVGEAWTAESTSREPTGRVSMHATCEAITVIEANLDDLNPQVFGYVMDRLLEEGALDAFGMPVQMKKNRPGMLLSVLCRPQDADQLTRLIFTETTTLGVRRRDEQRQTLGRTWVTVRTRWGEVRMKVASMNGAVSNYVPEYEDCRRIATEQRVPLKKVMQEATQAYLLLGDPGKTHKHEGP
jgi:uncharacterized protein (TIGR00299 family) protein